MPKLSIITINYENAPGLKLTVESVLDQEFTDLEYLVIDGGSRDGSREWIESKACRFGISWVSEPDNGIYHAMNKGIRQATGEYILFLNSGDFLLNPFSLDLLFQKEISADVVCADIKVVNGTSFYIKSPPDKLSFDYFIRDTLPHQSAIIKRALFDKVGFYNEELAYVSDWKFFLDAFCKHNASYQHVALILSEYNFDGISSKQKNAPVLQQERDQVILCEYPLFYQDYKNYDEVRAQLRNYNNSRGHSWLSRIIQLPIFQFLKRDGRPKLKSSL